MLTTICSSSSPAVGGSTGPSFASTWASSRLSLPDADEAKAATGYERGTITPFGSTHAWPVIADASIAALDKVAIGGGRRGVNVHLRPADLVAATNAAVVDVTVPASD